MKLFAGLSVGRGKGRMGEKMKGLRSTIGRHKIGDVKNSIGNGEAKELIFMTHGHELSGWFAKGNGGYHVEGGKGRKIGTTVIA